MTAGRSMNGTVTALSASECRCRARPSPSRRECKSRSAPRARPARDRGSHATALAEDGPVSQRLEGVSTVISEPRITVTDPGLIAGDAGRLPAPVLKVGAVTAGAFIEPTGIGAI